jgi:hypothetical protein
MQKKPIRVSTLDHEVIMEETTKCNRLEYKEDNDDEDKSNEDSEESKESESERE